MTTPPSGPPWTPRPRRARGHEWLAARAALAARRSARFIKAWGLSLGTLTLLALGVSLFGGDPESASRASSRQLAADTLRSAQRLREAGVAVSVADSVHRRARLQAPAPQAAPSQSRAPGPATAIGATTRQDLSPAVVDLSARIARARREHTVAAWIALSESPALSRGPRMRGLVNSLRSYDARARSVAVDAETVASRQGLQALIDRAGNTIVAIAENRRSELEARATPGASVAEPMLGAEAAPGTAPPTLAPPTPPTIATSAGLRAAQDSQASAQRTHDSLTTRAIAQQMANDRGSRGPVLGRVSPAIAMASLLVLGLLIRFAVALSREINAPALADAREAERVARAPVLATIREAMLSGPARFHPSGIDPFRILYLGLTATGTRARSAIVTGTDPVIVAATAARLAIAAAADHRQTLVVDLDVKNIPLSRTFREPSAPGVSDALAAAFTWREVARPIGSRDGLAITLLPAGTDRTDHPSGAALEELRASFVRLGGSFELIIVVAPPDRVDFAALLVEAAPVILTVAAGSTPVADLERELALLRAANQRIQGLVLWDTAPPELPSRAELAALLSQRRNHLSGGSFAAAPPASDQPNHHRKST